MSGLFSLKLHFNSLQFFKARAEETMPAFFCVCRETKKMLIVQFNLILFSL